MKCKLRLFLMNHTFTIYRCLYVFSFRLFSNISKTVFGPSLIWFCREFQALSFDNKKGFNNTDNRREIFKILRGPFFLGHPLYYKKSLKKKEKEQICLYKIAHLHLSFCCSLLSCFKRLILSHANWKTTQYAVADPENQ